MSLNILIVDDSATMRRMITRTLHLSGLRVDEVFEAANGREGLLVLTKNRIDLALIDINMPEMNGAEMIARIRQNPTFKELPVVVVSTEGSTTRIASLLEHTAVGFVHKPFTPEHLSQVVYEVTGGMHGEGLERPSAPVSGPDF